ncbi:MAG: hypothetical protein EXS55_00385 [Candidatus Magasanikbacteria bacterium]|nr:hypothetical protein [Candidatus Magasanikbacteria bacterium]
MNLTPLQKQELAEVLLSFGLKEKEQRVYIALLRAGQTTATPLARLAELPPTTTESILQRLLEYGLISASKHKSRHVYEAHDPTVLKRLLEKKLREVAAAIPLLQTIKKDYTTSTKVKIYYRDRLTDIFESAMNCKSKIIYEIVSPKNFQEILGEKYHFTKRRLEHGIKLKSLRVESHEIKKYSPVIHTRELREAKFLPRELTFQATILFWDTTVAIFATKTEGSAVTITSPVFSEMFKQLFDLLWSISRPMITA